MPFGGKQLRPRDVAALCHEAGWTDAVELTKAVATCLAESWGYVGAWHDNVDEAGALVSRDCGLFQINIPASRVGTEEETQLMTDPVYNVARARAMYERRRFQPWYAYTLGWATFPEWWIWYTKTDPHRWVPTGRYVHKAVRAVANFLAEEFNVRDPATPNLRWDPDFFPPLKPTEPPADDVGPRPVPNDGT